MSFCVRPFGDEFVNSKLLEQFLKRPELINEKRNLSENENDQTMYLYQYGVECDYFIVILSGEAELKVGKDGMEINAGLFSFYGVNALLNDESIKDAKSLSLNDIDNHNHNQTTKYIPEFSLVVNSYCVYMKITRAEWLDLVKKSLVKKAYETSKST
jgi:hypothetical protein